MQTDKTQRNKLKTESRCGLIALNSAALSAAGLFSIDMKTLYRNGSSAYITLPLSLMLVTAVLTTALNISARTGGLYKASLDGRGLYGPVFKAMSLPIAACMLIAAAKPLFAFATVLHGLFFEGVGYPAILFYLILPAVITAMLGLGALKRTALVYAPLLTACLIITVLSALPEFRLYRLFPFPGKGVNSLLGETLENTIAFIPAELCFFICSDELEDGAAAKRAVTASALIAGIVIFASHITLSLTFTYDRLANLNMPLFRANHLNMFETHLLRFDKLAHMFALNAALLGAGFYMLGTVRLLSAAWRVRTGKWAFALCGAVVGLLLMLIKQNTAVLPGAAPIVLETVFRACAILSVIALAAVTVSAGGIRKLSKTGRKTQ